MLYSRVININNNEIDGFLLFAMGMSVDLCKNGRNEDKKLVEKGE